MHAFSFVLVKNKQNEYHILTQCKSLHRFHEFVGQKIFFKNSLYSPLGSFFSIDTPSPSVDFRKKNFFVETRRIYATFSALFEYHIHFASVLSDKNEKLQQKSTFHEFYKRFPYFFAFSTCITTLYQTFFSSTFVSKDAEFRGLSDGRFKFLGQVCSSVLMPQIQLKSPFWTIDPPSLLEDKSITKHFALNI